MTKLIPALLAAVLILTSLNAAAATKYERRIGAASDVVEDLARIPEQGIPPSMLRDAYAIAVLPNVFKIGVGVGGRFGNGVLIQRQPDGRWSNPAFVNLGGGSIGLQLGAQSSDIVLVFKNKRSLDKLYTGRMTLGADVAVAAGPVGRLSSATTDVTLRTAAFSYSRNRGLFAGISLEGAVIGIDRNANREFYGDADGDAQGILTNDTIPTPAAARRLQETLTAAAAPLQWSPESGAQASVAPVAPTPAAAEEPAAQTYGLDDAPASGGEVVF